jgi:plasmid stabilization system protein ParE
MIPSVNPEVDRELTEGAVHYATEGNKELGEAFISEFERALDLLCQFPKLAAVWRGDRRRFPLRRFPYSIIYYLKGDDLRVVALAHHRRMPEYWSGRE